MPLIDLLKGLLTSKQANLSFKSNWSSRLYTPTVIEQYGEHTFIVDCWHHRVIYSTDTAIPIRCWNILTDRVGTPHSIASDGTFFLTEDSVRSKILVFRCKGEGYIQIQEITDVGNRPHRIIYDDETKRFYGVAANSGELFVLESRDGKVERIALRQIEMLKNCYTRSTEKLKKHGNIVTRLIDAFRRYGYLLRQLVSRDFKSKYKRSVLGVLWSFLNPLLTMLVQYIVFSTLFKSDIPNYPLYLLSGIVCFNFFSESTGMALQSITGNASLITKVYVPKYIYPLSRMLSSSINLLMSLIPLLLVMLLTWTPVRPAILLLPVGLVCLVGFCLGIGLILSTMMVFFRDTQFLWGVVSLLWMYATPIFYGNQMKNATRMAPLAIPHSIEVDYGLYKDPVSYVLFWGWDRLSAIF